MSKEKIEWPDDRNEKRQISNLFTNKISEKDFVIATPSIFALEDVLDLWLQSGDCGGIIVGRTRIGKTSALRYITNDLKKIYGDKLPVIIWELTEHTATDKQFYKSLLGVLGFGEDEIRRNTTAQDLRERTIRYLGVIGTSNPDKKILLIIDEAHKLAICEFDWLMDLYNCLKTRYGVMLTVIFSATKEIIAYRDSLISLDKNQIVERFMLNIHDFEGIKEKKELFLCLSEMDKVEVDIPGYEKPVKIAAFFFPHAYENDDEDEPNFFSGYTTEYWEAFQDVHTVYNKNEAKGIPMEYFMKSFIKLLIMYGAASARPAETLSKEIIYKSILATNYQKTSDNSSNYSTSSKASA